MRRILTLMALVSLGGCGGPETAPERPGLETRAIDGRWALAARDCSGGPGLSERRLTVTRTQIQVGQDICAIAEALPLSATSWSLYGECNAADGMPYVRDFEFERSGPDTLRWNLRDSGRVQDYVLCEPANEAS